MYFKQFYLGCLAHASYLIGDETSHLAAVIDPQRDIDIYLDEAAKQNLQIKHVILTHFHADFISGHIELNKRVDANIYLGAKAKAQYKFSPLSDGQVMQLGNINLKILETPGHTPESICVLVFDLSKNSLNPLAVLTGDTLFIGDVGRPDLLASVGVSENELASMLYDSLHTKILTLPDETLVYPAHGAGSMCGKNLSKETVSTIGVQRRINYALQPMTKAEFVKLVTTDQPDVPTYFLFDAKLNSCERPTLDKTLSQALTELSIDELLKLKNSGAQILDVRDPSEWAPFHLIGSINIGLTGQFAFWCGSILDKQNPIVIIAEPGKEKEAVIRLGRVGLDQIAGYLGGGMTALLEHNNLTERAERISAQELQTELASSRPPLVLDVRREKEWQEHHIEGSLNIPLNKLLQRRKEIPQDKNIVIHCAAGFRSSIAASLLRLHGIAKAPDLIGGIAAWDKAQNNANTHLTCSA